MRMKWCCPTVSCVRHANASPVFGLKNPSICRGCGSPRGSRKLTGVWFMIPPRLPKRYHVSLGSPSRTPRSTGKRIVAFVGSVPVFSSVIRIWTPFATPGRQSTVARRWLPECSAVKRYPCSTGSSVEGLHSSVGSTRPPISTSKTGP